MLIAYLHKIPPIPETPLTARDLLFGCFTHDIPVVLIGEESDHEEAMQLLGEVADGVQLVEPSDLYQVLLQTISSSSRRWLGLCL